MKETEEMVRKKNSPETYFFLKGKSRNFAHEVAPLSPEPEYDENQAPLGRDEGTTVETTPAPPTRSTRASAAPDASAALETVGVNVLFIGPTGSGKTETITAGQAACLAIHDPAWQIKFTFHGPMAELIRQRRDRIGLRQPNDATVAPADHRFGMELVRRTPDLREPRVVGACSASLLDGPGGATFPKSGDVVALSADMGEYRRHLIESGKTARALVIFVNVMTERDERSVAANITRLLGDMAVPTPVILDHPDRNGSGGRWSPFKRRVPPTTLGTCILPKIAADRLLFVLNHVDQLGVQWKQHWWARGDGRAWLSPLEIVRQEVNPVRLAFDVLGRDLLMEVESFLKPGAQLAAAVCSATGFVGDTGDPFCNADGTLNAQFGIHPEAMLERQVLYGVRETLVYAGFGYTAPGVVEGVTYRDFMAIGKEPKR